MIATIASGHADFADVMFLIAFILFAIEFVIRLVRPANWPFDMLLVVAGLACLALGWLVL
jgi:hypothetical protein